MKNIALSFSLSTFATTFTLASFRQSMTPAKNFQRKELKHVKTDHNRSRQGDLRLRIYSLRRDLKSGKVSFETDAKNRKQIDVSELTRVYGQLKHQNGTQPPAAETGEPAEPVNDTHQKTSMNGNETHQNLSMTENDTPKIVELLENQITDLKAQLAQAADRETATDKREVQTPRYAIS